MNEQRGQQPDRQLLFLQELVEEHATIAGDLVEVGTHTWAIHGSIAVDGEVIMAEYDTQDQARLVLDKLSAEEHRTAAALTLSRGGNGRGRRPRRPLPERPCPEPLVRPACR